MQTEATRQEEKVLRKPLITPQLHPEAELEDFCAESE